MHRRDFLYGLGASLGSVAFSSLLTDSVHAADGSRQPHFPEAKAKHCIFLYMEGGPSHLDTFDLKPGQENQGETKPIKTNVPGRRISEFLPMLAGQFDKLAAIRSMYTETGAHEPGQYLMHTSYKMIATTRHPWMGPWAQKVLGAVLRSSNLE